MHHIQFGEITILLTPQAKYITTGNQNCGLIMCE